MTIPPVRSESSTIEKRGEEKERGIVNVIIIRESVLDYKKLEKRSGRQQVVWIFPLRCSSSCYQSSREKSSRVSKVEKLFLLTTRDTRYVNSCPHFYPIKLDVCSTESVTGVILHRLAGFLCVLIRENRISEIRHAVIVNLALLLILKFRLFVCYARRRRRTNVHYWLEIF